MKILRPFAQPVISDMSSAIDTDNSVGSSSIGIGWYSVLVLYYSAISLFFMKFYQHAIAADGTSYISIAQKYLSGSFSEAVNGYWSPLISLLMVPFLSFNIEPFSAFMALSFFTGLIALAGIDMLLKEIKVTKRIRILYLLSLSPVIAYWAENSVNADMLSACVLIYYLVSIRELNPLNLLEM